MERRWLTGLLKRSVLRASGMAERIMCLGDGHNRITAAVYAAAVVYPRRAQGGALLLCSDKSAFALLLERVTELDI